ncbi:TonB-dependent receptor [Marinoscillum sp. MHG1-6]|uniref:TonB-dependent receptor n=1 Tax=Marinoscillum sp. MHG1-6 TaxID=2959627 RepID=UPI0021586F5B|nr:TonB-dependent receptor [Marinoscillum sp. MHG1-6]
MMLSVSRACLLIGMLLLLFQSLRAQSVRDVMIKPADNGRILNEFLEEKESEYGVDFIFEKSRMEALNVSGVREEDRLEDFLKDYFVSFGLALVKASDKIALIVDEQTERTLGRIKSNYLVVNTENSSGRFRLEGKIKEADYNEPLVGAQIVIKDLESGTLSDINGHFELWLPMGYHNVEIRNVGHSNSNFVIGYSSLAEATGVSITMFPSVTELDELVITAEKENINIKQTYAGVESMGIEAIKMMPTFLGEINPIKSITALPGVSSVGEIASGYNVRGGEAGQNLILQDRSVIYNPTHLFGMFSAFNPDIVSNVSLHKGAGPPSFGGRVSSVLDISLRNGDLNRNIWSAGVGIISSHLTTEGPIIKDRLSYIIGGRYSYSDWFLKALNNEGLNDSNADFYDITGKLTYKLNDKNYISLSGYSSHDCFKVEGDSTYSWNSLNFNILWDHTFGAVWSSSLSLSRSQYSSQIDNEYVLDAFTYKNGINDLSLKFDLTFKRSEKMAMNFGLDANYYLLRPGEVIPSDSLNNTPAIRISNQRIFQPACYYEISIEPTEKVGLNIGLRYSQFYRMGPEDILSFDYNNFDGRNSNIQDSLSYAAGEVVKFYHNLEPRISMRYAFNDKNAVKAGYGRATQYLHLMSNTTSTTPYDYWISSGPHLKPLISDQFTFGYFKNLKENTYELSVEAFYKVIHNAVDYYDGADITVNPALESVLSQGRGLSYGLELYMKKAKGEVNGWVAYTYSRSLRRFEPDQVGRIINQGKYYPSIFDQPHNLTVVLNYRARERVSYSANFSYSTGRPITIPVSKYEYDPYLAVLNYSERNEYRIPDYHRLDLSMNIQERKRNSKSYQGEWVISIFNVYGRDNAYSIFFNRYGRAKQLTILGSVFPSVSYKFRF